METYQLFRRTSQTTSYDWCVGVDSENRINTYEGNTDKELKLTVYPAPLNESSEDYAQTLINSALNDGYELIHTSVEILRNKVNVPDGIDGYLQGISYSIKAGEDGMFVFTQHIAEVMLKNGCDVRTQGDLVEFGKITYSTVIPSTRSKYAKAIDGILSIETPPEPLLFLLALRDRYPSYVSVSLPDGQELNKFSEMVDLFTDLAQSIVLSAEDLDLKMGLSRIPGESFYF